MAETEDADEAFAEALERLVQHCRKRDPRIGQAVSVDATMSETNARLHKLGKNGELPKRIGKLPVAAAPRLPTQIVDDIRRAENSETPEAKKLRVSEYLDVTHQVASQVAGGFKVINLKSGAYLIRDPDAGVRAYIRNGKLLKWWVGYFLIQGVDHFTGLPLRAHGFAADENESTHYTTVVEKSIATLGRVPDYVTTDRAYYVKDCFEWSVVRGITLVSPYKAREQGRAEGAGDHALRPAWRSPLPRLRRGHRSGDVLRGGAQRSKRQAAPGAPLHLRRATGGGLRRHPGEELPGRPDAAAAGVAHAPRLLGGPHPPPGARAGTYRGA